MASSRLTLDLNEAASAKLAALSGSQDASKAEIIRRALILYSFLNTETQDGRKLMIVGADGQPMKEIVMGHL